MTFGGCVRDLPDSPESRAGEKAHAQEGASGKVVGQERAFGDHASDTPGVRQRGLHGGESGQARALDDGHEQLLPSGNL